MARAFEPKPQRRRPIAQGETGSTAALDKIGGLYGIETQIRGRSADVRREQRQARTKPLINDLKLWLDTQLSKLSKNSTLAEAIRYRLNRWTGLCHFR